jgi:SAM-dependent methyltransferase
MARGGTSLLKARGFVQAALLLLLLAPAAAGLAERHTQTRPGSEEPPDELPPHLVYLPMDVAERLLALAEVGEGQLVYDLGCGDGRVSILAVRKFRARSACVDHDARRMAEARANVEREGVTAGVTFLEQETADLADADVVTMTLPQSAQWLGLNGLLNPTLSARMKPGARIVSNFVPGSMAAWKPDQVDRFVDAKGAARAILYRWTIDGRAR